MTTRYTFYPMAEGIQDYSLPFSDRCFNVLLLSGTNVTLTVPGDSNPGVVSNSSVNNFIVQLKYSQDDSGDPADVWVSINEAAVVPISNVFAATSSILNPRAKTVKAGDVINFITANTEAYISVEFFAIS